MESGLPGEIGIGSGIIVITAVLFFLVKMVFETTSVLKKRFTEILPYTLNAADGKKVILQDLSKDPDAIPILPSDNERTGIEFSYSFFLYVNEGTITGQDVLKSVFYKGYDGSPWPLMAPGVFIKGETNTMRIVYNSSAEPYNFVDVENIPIGKYFHTVLNFKSGALEVHINGRIVKKLTFPQTIPYSNFGNIVIFNNYDSGTTTINRPPYGNIRFEGAINGQISNLMYTRYALSFGEIQNLLNKGASNVIKQTTKETPPYLADSWWSDQ
jgi:hypothetical protein